MRVARLAPQTSHDSIFASGTATVIGETVEMALCEHASFCGTFISGWMKMDRPIPVA